jgi:hypothetical protein
MAKYFVLAVLFAAVSFGASADKNDGPACGLGVASGLCVLAAAVVECKSVRKEEKDAD